MADIFISYSKSDRPKAKAIAEALEQHGWSVWWDRKIPFGKTWDEIIEQQVDAASCLIVLWSKESVSSNWVKTEAREGKSRGILIPIKIEDVIPPLEFRHMQTASLVDWESPSPHPEFNKLLEELKEILGSPQVEATKQIGTTDVKTGLAATDPGAAQPAVSPRTDTASAGKSEDLEVAAVIPDSPVSVTAKKAARAPRQTAAKETAGVIPKKAVKGDVKSAPVQETGEEQITKLLASLSSRLTQAEARSDWDTVIELGEHLLRFDPEHPFIRAKVATACYSRGMSCNERGDYDRALSDANRALELDPGRADYYYLRGLTYNNKANSDAALVDLDRAINLDPSKPDFYWQRGASYVGKDYSRALADLDRAIQLDPQNGQYYSMRVITHVAHGNRDRAREDHERAVELLNHAIETDAQKSDYFLSRGMSYLFGKGDIEQALSDFDHGIELSPMKWSSHALRATAYLAKGAVDPALVDLDRAVELDPNHADLHLRGMAFANKGDYERALADLNHAIELNPNDADYYGHRGSLLNLKGEFDKALDDLNRAIELNSKSAEYYYQRGVTYIHKGNAAWLFKGDYDRALADFDRAIKLDPNMAAAYWQRGVCYMGKGYYEQALADVNRAIKIDPENGTYHLSRGLIYKAKGDTKAARRDITRAMDLGEPDAKGELAQL